MKRSTLVPGLLAVCMIASIAVGARAATPAEGRVDAQHRKVVWSGGPVTGSAPSKRNASCRIVNCDDFSLTINAPKSLFKAPTMPVVTLRLTTTEPNDIRMLVSKPGSDNSTASTDYADYGTSGDLILPAAGVWRIRAACYACANASYTIVAQLKAYQPPKLEPLSGFSWASTLIPGPGVGEPGVAVDRQNRVFVNGPLDGDVNGGTAWASYNLGKTWESHQGIDVTGTSGDSDLTVAPDDSTVYFMNLSSAGFSNMVYASADHGKTWTGPSVAGTESDRQWFTAAPNGRVYVTYHDLGNPVAQMYVMRSDDHAKTFVPVSSVALAGPTMVDTWCGNHEAGRPQVDPHNPDIYYIFYSIAPFADCAAAPIGNDHELSQVWLAKSVDAGRTFTHTKVYQSTSGNTDHNLMGMDVDNAGNIYIVIAESNGKQAYSPVATSAAGGTKTVPRAPGETDLSTHVKMFVSKDKGVTWSKPIAVDQLKDHHSNVFAAVTAGDAGRVNIAWYTSRASDFLDASATWTVAMAQTTNALSANPTFTQTRVSPGVMHIGGICQAGLGCTATGVNRNLADFLGIDIGPDGKANVVWADDTSGSTRVAYGRQTGGVSLKAPRTSRR